MKHRTTLLLVMSLWRTTNIASPDMIRGMWSNEVKLIVKVEYTRSMKYC